ncbi:hypothetical protein LTR17_005170 [Elasticomyces elasticus]|nr:hypothetical protein LTR17_005170 [Elasticomyces elasticus]
MASRPNLVQPLIEGMQDSLLIENPAFPEDRGHDQTSASSPGLLSIPQELRDIVYDFALQGAGPSVTRSITEDVIIAARARNHQTNLATFKALCDSLPLGRKHELSTRLFKPDEALYTSLADLRWLLNTTTAETLASIRIIVVDMDTSISAAVDYFSLDIDTRLPNLKAEFLGHGSYNDGHITPGRKTTTYHTKGLNVVCHPRLPSNFWQLSRVEKKHALREYTARRRAARAAPAEEHGNLQDLAKRWMANFPEVPSSEPVHFPRVENKFYGDQNFIEILEDTKRISDEIDELLPERAARRGGSPR